MARIRFLEKTDAPQKKSYIPASRRYKRLTWLFLAISLIEAGFILYKGYYVIG